MDQELYYQMAMSLVQGVGPVMGKSLIAYCGSAEAVFNEKKSRLAKIPNIGTSSAESLFRFKDFERVDRELEFIANNDIRAIQFFSPEYPLRLKQELDSPLVLFVKGRVNLNHSRIIAIVGTRKNSQQGAEITKEIVKGLNPFDCYTISGLAYGIDIVAHKSSLDFQIPTIAVVAHGLDTTYPSQHHKYAQKIIENGGGIVTEHFSNTALNPDLFPRRNRIVAAMCDGIVVIESQKKGGSMITADIASGYNRDVFAVPGRPGEALSEGCNFLIKSLKAALCENSEDIAHAMNWDITEHKSISTSFQTELFQELSEEEKKVINFLNNGDRAYDDILINTDVPMSRLSFILIELELKNLIQLMPGKKYRRLG